MASKSDQDWQLSKKTVLERNFHMLNNPLMSDIKFTCGESKGKYFYAHKYVLATSSPVFYAMFYGDLAEKNSVIHLPDTDEESFKAFLCFVYTDDIPEGDIPSKLIYLAKKYMVPALRTLFFQKVNNSNVFALLNEARQYDEHEEEKNCWRVVDTNITTIALKSEAFEMIDQATLTEVLQRDTLRIEEVDLFKAVLKWSDRKCRNKGVTINGVNRRACLGDALQEIRFPSMSEKEFAESVIPTGILTNEEAVAIFLSFNGQLCPESKWKSMKRNKIGKQCYPIEEQYHQCCARTDAHIHGCRIWGINIFPKRTRKACAPNKEENS